MSNGSYQHGIIIHFSALDFFIKICYSKNIKEVIRKILILPDLQIPYEDKETLQVVEKYMGDNRWDEVVYLGDFLDFDQISKYNKEALRKVEGKRILADYEAGNKILDRHQELVKKNNKKAKFTLLEGNHEERVEKYIDANPNLEGLFEVEKGLKLKERGFNWIRCSSKGEIYKIGKAYFIHGLYTNQYHAAKMVNNFGVNIYYGHTHDIQSYSKVLRGKDKTLEGQSMGCLCRYDQSYIKGNPTRWQQAFGVMYVFPDGYYNLYTIKIFKHRFISPDNKIYK